jgi:thiamine transporter ThiT
MLIVVFTAHCPAFGVKVYVCVPLVVVETVDGFQVPVIAGLLVELVGKVAGA